MPLCTLHLLSLNAQTSPQDFIKAIHAWGIKPLTIAKVIRWIIVPEQTDTAQLLSPSTPYTLLLILPDTKPLPGPLTSKLDSTFTLTIGIPSALLKTFHDKNQTLLHPARSDNKTPALTGSLEDPIVDPKSSQTLTLSPELQSWITTFAQTHTGRGAVSMLNLLAFRPGKKESYLRYGKAFAETIGSKRGGDAKLVGHVVYAADSTGDGKRWDEFALAHYPSILHFADMLASKDYQDVNQTYRVPALRDTCILCTSEIDVEEMLKVGNPKL